MVDPDPPAVEPRPAPPSSSSADEYSFLVGFEGEWRDTWWSPDFLELLARRLRLSDARAVVDVGCGVGHWGRTLLPWLHPDATLIGVDREPSFVEQATAAASERGITRRASYRTGVAEALPVPDASADLVTCQTVLMHVADPAAVLAEMRRVLRPGGLLFVAEPNNFAEKATGLVGLRGLSRAEKLGLLELELICEDGKKALGRGDSSIGELLPGMFHEAGFVDVRACQSEKCAVLVPPYEAREQRIELGQMLSWIEGGVWLGAGGTRDQTLEIYRAGGGDMAAFDALWALAMKETRLFREAALARTLTAARGVTFYVVSGRAPS